MSRFVSLAALSVVALLPGEASAIVWFGRIEPGTQIVAQPNWPEGLADVLNGWPRLAGTTFVGWGMNQQRIFYAGEAAAAAALFDEIARIERMNRPAGGMPVPVEVSLSLLPGRGRLGESEAKNHRIPAAFDYDLEVAVSVHFGPLMTHTSRTVAVTDDRGREVNRVARTRGGHGVHVRVFWYVGDGSALDEVALPGPLLFAVERGRDSWDLFQPPLAVAEPDPAEVPAKTRLAADRIDAAVRRAKRAYELTRAAWRVSEFYGVTVDLDFDGGTTPRVRATYGGKTAVFDAGTGKPAEPGSNFPPTAADLVARWLGERRDDVTRQWENAAHDRPVEMIEPLE